MRPPESQASAADFDNLIWILKNQEGVMCHICKRTGVRTCDEEDAETKCMVCGLCAAEKARVEREKGFEHELAN